MEKCDLLIAIPTKSEPHYLKRKEICEATWLKNCSVDYKFFSDTDLGVDPNDEQARPKRTQRMCKYAVEHGYDFIFRVDSDAYVWVERLLRSDFHRHEYTGYCVDYPVSNDISRTAHGGCGFILNRRAMQIVANAPITRCKDGKYWGDIWTGEVLYRHGIRCNRDTRFYSDKFMWDGKDLSEAISIHPVIEDD